MDIKQIALELANAFEREIELQYALSDYTCGLPAWKNMFYSSETELIENLRAQIEKEEA